MYLGRLYYQVVEIKTYMFWTWSKTLKTTYAWPPFLKIHGYGIRNLVTQICASLKNSSDLIYLWGQPSWIIQKITFVMHVKWVRNPKPLLFLRNLCLLQNLCNYYTWILLVLLELQALVEKVHFCDCSWWLSYYMGYVSGSQG